MSRASCRLMRGLSRIIEAMIVVRGASRPRRSLRCVTGVLH